MASRTVSVNLVANVGQYVSAMAQASGATKGLGDTADTTTNRTRGGFDLAGKGALLMGGAVAAGMGMAISKSMEFEKAVSGIGAATQASGSQLDKFRDAAMRAGADTQYSATEAANAITEMAKAGVSSTDILGGGLTGALNLAAAGQLDVADAAGIASVAMTQFNLSGRDLPHVADLLAAGAGKAMGSVDDLGQALNQSGLIASAAGLSIEETTGSLAAFANAGLIGSDAGTSFKSMLQAIQAPSGKAAELMAQLGISMYDSSGNMLGASDMAGMLQSKLGGLTEEQRNSALATIFGSDAVRAANVFYKEGASGIDSWIKKVNDQGFAAQQAAALTDNLAGDLERLGGSFDTLLITLGEGAQGPLRILVQTLGGIVDGITWMVNAWDSIPGPVQAGIAALAAVNLLSGPVQAGFKGVSFAVDVMTASMANAGGPMALMRSGAGGLLGVLGGPWGIAIAGATVALTGLWSWLNTTSGATDQAKSATEAYASALQQSSGALDANVRAAAAKAAEDSGLLAIADSAGVKLNTVTDAIMGQSGALESVQAKLRAYIEANTIIMQTENGPQKHLTDEAKAAQEALAALDLLAKQGPETAASQERVASATGTATSAADQFAAATKAAKDQVDTARSAVDNFKLSLDILSGAHVSMIQVESAFQAAVAAADGAVNNMSGTVLDATGSLNLQSESGRRAAEVLLGVRDSGNRLISTLIQQGATEDDVRGRDAQLRQSFIDTAMRMGISRQAAENLANQILGIPDRRNTTISADVGQAQRDIDGFVNSNSGRVIRLGVGIAAGDWARAQQIANARNNAMGGFQVGPGTGTSDDILSWLSDGEFVVKASETAKHRPLLEAINSGAPIPRFADGGMALRAMVNTDPVQAEVNANMDDLAKRFNSALAEAAVTSGGVLGAGAVGGGWTSIFNWVKARIPQARANSTYRPGDPGYHGRGKAVDFGFGSGPGGNGSAGLALINRTLHDGLGRNLAELIYDGIGDDRSDLKNGRPLTYNAATRAAHHNHVHAAVYDQGGWLQPGLTMAYNGTGAAERVLTSREFSGSTALAGSGGAVNVQVNARVFIGDREITDIARVQATAVMVGALDTITSRGRNNP